MCRWRLEYEEGSEGFVLLRSTVEKHDTYGAHNHPLKTTTAEVKQSGATRERIPDILLPFGRSMAKKGLPIADIHQVLQEHAKSYQLPHDWSSKDVETMFKASADEKQFDSTGTCLPAFAHY